MTEFYTNVAEHGNQLLVCGYKDGTRFKRRVPYKPYLFVPTHDADAEFKTIHGDKVERIDFDTMWECRRFIKDYGQVENFAIFGLDRHQYVYINDRYGKQIKPDTKLIKTVALDIEVATDDGYPDINTANKQITAITLMYKDITWCLGLKDVRPQVGPDVPKLYYVFCVDEVELLKRFIKIIESERFRPDVITGWNIEMFDIPYCVNRIRRILGDSEAKKLSPFNVIVPREFESFGKLNTAYTPVGVNILDYLSMYKKFTYHQLESYKLDNVCEFELGTKKIDYSEYGSLNALYVQNPQLYYEYNIQDCWLIFQLDAKMKLLDLVYGFAYDSGTNFVDALTSVRAWDVIIHNYLIARKTVIPTSKPNNASMPAEGAHVKDPLVGKWDWVVSFDLTSLYPHLIMQYNISPDTLVGFVPGDTLTVDQLLDGAAANYHQLLDDNNYALAASGVMFRKDKQGFLAALMEDLFNQRKQIKKAMLDAQQQNEKNPSSELDNLIASLDTQQKAIKIKLNSAYGALLNAGNRWNDIRLGESITKGGQLTIRTAEKYINQYLNSRLKTGEVDYVIASDTDSIYLNFAPLLEKSLKPRDSRLPWEVADKIKALDWFCEQQIQPFLDTTFKELATYMRAYKQAMHMKREAICEKAVFVAKKRYFASVWNNEGVQYDKPKLKIMGVDAVRSSTPALSREKIKACLDVILNKSQGEAIDFIEKVQAEYQTASYDQISWPRTVNGLVEYANVTKSVPIHVRGSLLYNKLIDQYRLNHKYNKIVDKEKIKFAYLVEPNPIRSNVIAAPGGVLPDEFGLNDYIDRNKQFEKGFMEPIRNIMTVIGWKAERKASVFSFFGE